MHAQQTALNAPHLPRWTTQKRETIWMENIVKGIQRTQSGCWKILGEPERGKAGKFNRFFSFFSVECRKIESAIARAQKQKHNRKWGEMKAQRSRWKGFESNKKPATISTFHYHIRHAYDVDMNDTNFHSTSRRWDTREEIALKIDNPSSSTMTVYKFPFHSRHVHMTSTQAGFARRWWWCPRDDWDVSAWQQ